MLIALTAYLISPDPTPNANRIVVEIAARKPGFTMSFLLLPKDIKKEPPSFFVTDFFGRDDDYNYTPINSFEQRSDSLVIYRFIDEAVQERQSYWIPALKQRADGLNEPWLIKTKTFWLGTDRYGRDILSRLIVGVRVSLAL